MPQVRRALHPGSGARQVGLDRYTVVPGRNLPMNSAPTRRLPVPDSDCSVATRPCRGRNPLSNSCQEARPGFYA